MESSRSKSDRVAWTYLSQEKYNPRTVRAGRASNRQGEQTFYSACSPRISYPANKSETLNQSAYRSPFLSISTAYRSFPRKRSQHFKRENKRSQGRQWITACATYFRYHVSSPLRSIDFRFERKPRPASWWHRERETLCINQQAMGVIVEFVVKLEGPGWRYKALNAKTRSNRSNPTEKRIFKRIKEKGAKGRRNRWVHVAIVTCNKAIAKD